MGRPSRTGASTGPRAQVPSEPKKGRNTASASHADTRPVCRGAAREEVRTEAAASLGLGSPSGRTPWTSCPVTWLFGVETGGRPRCPGEARRWGGPAAESSRSAPASLRRPESWEGGPGCRADFQARGGALRRPAPRGRWDLRPDSWSGASSFPWWLLSRPSLSDALGTSFPGPCPQL